MSPAPDPSSVDQTLFVSWMRYHGRSAGLCAALPATCAFVGAGRVANPRTAPLRHLVQAVRTIWLLVRRRPRVLWVMAPPSDLVVIGLLWRLLSRGTLVVDAHSNAVVDARTGRRRTTRWLRRADLVVVTTPRLARLLTADGVRARPLHDPPLTLPPRPARGHVVMPASWYSDEPWQDVLAAAELLPDVPFAVTGRPPERVAAPPNVRLTGYLPSAEYDELVASADVVLALTTREDTMQRAAYEAVAVGRPLVASGTDALREHLTQGTVFTAGGAADLARAVREALGATDRLSSEMAELRTLHQAGFDADLAAVRAAVAEAS